MASLTYIAAAAILMAANSATGGVIDPAPPLQAVASCLAAIVNGLLIRHSTVSVFRGSKTLKETLPTTLNAIRRQDPHA